MIRMTAFCVNRDCPFRDCFYHITHAPKKKIVTFRSMDGTCRRYIRWLVKEMMG